MALGSYNSDYHKDLLILRSRFHDLERSRIQGVYFRILAIALGLGILASAAIWFFGFGRALVIGGDSESATTQIQLLKIKADIIALQEKLEIYQTSPTTPREIGGEEFTLLKADVKKIEEAQKQISDALLADPAKALHIPLILRDIDSIKQSQTQSIAAVQQDIGRLYAITGGAITFLFTVLLPLGVNRLYDKKTSASAEEVQKENKEASPTDTAKTRQHRQNKPAGSASRSQL